jgi:hypothetical protein
MIVAVVTVSVMIESDDGDDTGYNYSSDSNSDNSLIESGDSKSGNNYSGDNYGSYSDIVE